MENVTWWNNVFNLKEKGKTPAKSTADKKNPKRYLISIWVL